MAKTKGFKQKLKKKVEDALLAAISLIAFAGLSIFLMTLWTSSGTQLFNSGADVDSSTHYIIKNDSGEKLYELTDVSHYHSNLKTSSFTYKNSNGELKRIDLSGNFVIETHTRGDDSLPKD